MVLRNDKRDPPTRKEDDDTTRIDDDDPMATPSPPIGPAGLLHPTPTDIIDDDDHSWGPSSSTTWSQVKPKPKPTPSVIPNEAGSWTSSSAQPTTLVTSTVSSSSFPKPLKPPGTVVATAAVSDDLPTITQTVYPGAGVSVETERKQSSSNNAGVYAAAGVVPVVVIAIVGFIVFFCLRKRRRQQRQLAATQSQAQEMKLQHPAVYAHMAPAVPVSRAPSYTSHATMASSDAANLPPVILGPISAGSNSNYMTGIDTSEVMSTRGERTGLGDPFADGSSLHEEPPPPYRARSLGSAERWRRQSSMRNSNPFEDLREEDDGVSVMSSSGLSRNRDDLSAVSDLSYQRDDGVDRGTVPR